MSDVERYVPAVLEFVRDHKIYAMAMAPQWREQHTHVVLTGRRRGRVHTRRWTLKTWAAAREYLIVNGEPGRPMFEVSKTGLSLLENT